MFATVVIVLREVLEAAIVIDIVAAATRSIPGRNRWLAAGVLAGLGGSVLVAAFTDVIGSLASGIGQELFNRKDGIAPFAFNSQKQGST